MTRSKFTAAGLAILAALIVLTLILSQGAFAAVLAEPEGESALKINWGESAAWALTALGGIATWLVGTAIGYLPGPARWGIKLTQIDQVIYAAIDAWVNDHADELKNRGWTVDLRNQAVRDVAVTSLNTGNKFVRSVRDTLPDKVKARLQKYIEERYGEPK